MKKKSITFRRKFEYLGAVARSGFLISTLTSVLINGSSNTSLEIARLSHQLKMVKKYRKLLRKFIRKSKLEKSVRPLKAVEHKIVWVCWLQGMESAPEIVKLCYKSLEKIPGGTIRFLTAENFSQYTKIPNFIIEKWKGGKISNAHFSDLIRVDLLTRQGGIWIDATVYNSGDQLPSCVGNSWLFFYQILKPGLDGHAISMSSWVMSSVAGNPILEIVRDFLFDYWEKHNRLDDYFLFHIVMMAVLNEFPTWWNRVHKVCNSTPHILQLEMLEDFNQQRFDQIMSLTTLHKLTYKYNLNEVLENSTLRYILSRDAAQI